ncbi:MAG: hypothetical protein R3276_08465 [Marinobacter sp.]|nr:hypothetical protein [Marinobacter sp.]
MNRLTKTLIVSLATTMPFVANAHYGHENWAPGEMPMMTQDEMDGLMDQMGGVMARIHEETSPEQRQELMNEHMRLMQRYMYMMHGSMGGPGMMMGQGMMGGPGMMQGGQHEPGRGMMGGDPADSENQQDRSGMTTDQRLQYLDQRLNRMQLMMEQMLRRQGTAAP